MNNDTQKQLLKELEAYWNNHPSLRLGQLIHNMTMKVPYPNRDVFYVTDEMFLQLFEQENKMKITTDVTFASNWTAHEYLEEKNGKITFQEYNDNLIEISGLRQEENILISKEDFNRIAKAFCQ